MRSAFTIIILTVSACLPLAAQKQAWPLIDSLLKVSTSGNDTAQVTKLLKISFAFSGIETAKGLRFGDSALALARKAGWTYGEAWALNSIAVNRLNRSDFSSATDALYQSRRLLGNSSRPLVPVVTRNLGVAYTGAGRVDSGICYTLKAFDLYRAHNDRDGMAAQMNNIGYLMLDNGQYKKADRLFARASRLARENGNRIDYVIYTNNRAFVCNRNGNCRRAAKIAIQCIAASAALGDNYCLFLSEKNLGESLMLRGKYNDAAPHLRTALTAASTMGSADRINQAHQLLARNYLLAAVAAKDSSGKQTFVRMSAGHLSKINAGIQMNSEDRAELDELHAVCNAAMKDLPVMLSKKKSARSAKGELAAMDPQALSNASHYVMQ